MTLVAAWIRNRHRDGIRELIVASDSRVTGGLKWDFAPKIVMLSRGDAVIGFSGETQYAYPLIMQLKSSLDQHPQSKTRAFDLTELISHITGVLNYMTQSIAELPIARSEFLENFCNFILAGYSWKRKDFVIYTFTYDSVKDTFRGREHGGQNKSFRFIGDEAGRAASSLQQLLGDKNTIDYEPLEVLVSQIEDNSIRSVGGPIQLVKIYEHMNTMPFATLWRKDKNTTLITYLGRPLLEYERTQYMLFNPYDKTRTSLWKYKDREEVLNGEVGISVEEDADVLGVNSDT